MYKWKFLGWEWSWSLFGFGVFHKYEERIIQITFLQLIFIMDYYSDPDEDNIEVS